MSDSIISMLADEAVNPSQPAADKTAAAPERESRVAGAGPAAFVQEYAPLARDVGQKIGVAPEVLLGQWGLETGWGRSVIPGTNNLGNIKDFSGQGPKATDSQTGSRDAYRAYQDGADFGSDFVRLITGSGRYKGAVGKGGDAAGYFSALKNGGYAEDPAYVQKGVAAARLVSGLMGNPSGDRDYYTPPDLFSPGAASAPLPERGILGAINDTGIDTANAAVGLVKSGVDLFAPGSSISNAMGEFIRYGEELQSDRKKALNARLREDLRAAGDNEWDKAGIQLAHSLTRDPLGTVGQIFGNVGPFAILGRGLRAAQLAEGVRTAISMGVAGGMSAGEVRGNIWDNISQLSDAELREASPAYDALRQRGMSEEDAKKEIGANLSRNLPEVALAGMIGALSGKFGAEAMATGVAPRYAGSRLGASVVGMIDEGPIQGGSEQLASNYGTRRVLPNHSLTDNLGSNIVLEGIPGGAMGATFGGSNAHVQPPKQGEPAAEQKPGPLARAAQLGAPAGASPAEAGSQPGAQVDARDELSLKAVELARFVTSDEISTLLPGEERSTVMQLTALAGNQRASAQMRQDALDQARGIVAAYQAGAQPGSAADEPVDDVGAERQPGAALLGLSAPARPVADRPVSTGTTEAGQDANTTAMQRLAALADEDGQAGAAEPIPTPAEVAGQRAAASAAADAAASRLGQLADEEAPAPEVAPSQPPAAPAAPASNIPAAEAPARREVAAPDVAIPAGEGPAAKRQRKAQLRALVEGGFSTIERDGDGSAWLVNDARNERTRLVNTGDALMARKLIDDYVNERSHEAAASPLNDKSEPTDGQKSAGNYAKGHLRINGFDVSVENPRGSTRSGVSPEGKPWSSTMTHHYGYLKRTEGADGDQVDVFIGPRPDSQLVYVVDQVNPETGEFDEHKVLFGFTSERAAREGYLSNYEPGWRGLGAIHQMTVPQFQQWLKETGAKKPASAQVQAESEAARAQNEAQAQHEAELQAVEALKRETGNPNIKLADPNDPRTQALNALLDAFAAVTGKRGIAVEATGQGAFDGVESDGNFFINIDRPQAHVGATIGHEFKHLSYKIHGIGRLYDRLWGLMSEEGKRAYYEGYLARVTKGLPASYDQASAEHKQLLKEEMLADFMGKRFNDEVWLRELAKQQPALFGDFVRDWIKLLGELVDHLRGMIGLTPALEAKQRIDGYVTELQQAQKIAMEIAVEWAKQSPMVARKQKAGEDVARYARRVELMDWAGAFKSGQRDLPRALEIMRAPPMSLRMAGMPSSSNIVITTGGLSHFERRGHAIDPQVIGRLPELLASPRAVMVTYEAEDGNSSFTPGSGVKRISAILDARDSMGRPYLVGIRDGMDGAGIADIRTLFGKDNSLSYVLRAISSGTFVWLSEKEVDRVKAITGWAPIAVATPEGSTKPKLPEQSPKYSQGLGDQPIGIVYGQDALRKFMSGGDWQSAGVAMAVPDKAPQRSRGAHFSAREDLTAEEMDDLQAELDAMFAENEASKRKAQDFVVEDSDVKSSGLMAEDAFQGVIWEDVGHGMREASVMGLFVPGKSTTLTMEEVAAGKWRVDGLYGTWVGPAADEAGAFLSERGAEDFVRRQVASVDLHERGFDLDDAITSEQRKAIVAAWRHFNGVDKGNEFHGVRRNARPTGVGKTFTAIADGMGLLRFYDLTVHMEKASSHEQAVNLALKHKSQDISGDVRLDIHDVDGRNSITVHSTGLGKQGLGSVFYQLVAEYAARTNGVVTPDFSLSSINTYRRTEQMLSAAMRTGKSNVMLPHQTQRVYGFNDDASTQAEHDANLARLLLAGLRNVRELAPGVDRLNYHPETGVFTTLDGRDAKALVDDMLADDDARALGLSRTQIARAVLTRMAMDGKIDAGKVEAFAEPVLYSARDTAAMEYEAVRQKYTGTDQWMKAPNGQPTKLNERQWVQVRTPSFKRWFGDWEAFAGRQGGVWSDDSGAVSKVVDENGEPLVVYHGTDHGGFMRFKEPGGSGRGDLGIFTSSNRDMALSYVRQGRAFDIEAPDERDMLADAGIEFTSRMGRTSSRDSEDRLLHYYETPGGDEVGPFDSLSEAEQDAAAIYLSDADFDKVHGIYAMFANIRNPNEKDFEGALWSGSRDHQWVVEVGGEQQYTPDGQGYFSSAEEAAEFARDFVSPDDENADPLDYVRGADEHHYDTDGVVREARALKMDGAIIRRVVDDGGGIGYDGEPSDVFVAIKPEQLKSADWNTGEFGDSTDLRYSAREKPVYTHYVVDPRNGNRIVGRYQSAKTARMGRDRLDNIYGGYRYKVVEAETGQPKLSARDAFDVSLSAATDSIPGLKLLQERANAGDTSAAWQLNSIAYDALQRLTSEIPSARVERNNNYGLYFSQLEPSLGLSVTFEPQDREPVLAALARFADNFNQHQVHVRQSTSDPEGTIYDDGSWVTLERGISLKSAMSREQVQEIIDASGLVGMTYNSRELFSYYIGSPEDENAIRQFEQGFDRAIAAVGENGERARRAASRIWVYGRGDVNGEPVIPYSAIAGDVRTGPARASKTALRVAEDLAGRTLAPAEQQDITAQQRALQERIRDAYEALPLNDLDNPDVRRAYDELATEVLEQFDHLPIKVEVLSGQGEPYANSEAMRRDVLDHNHLFIFGTDKDTFGPPGVVYDDHPLLRAAGRTDLNGHKLVFNDLLRAVHDYYAHTMSPVEFGPKGEEAAWKNHMAMTKSPWARWALTSETRGQNSWVNFRDGADRMTPMERGFAVQKVGLLPLSMTLGAGRSDTSMQALANEIGAERAEGSLKPGWDADRVTPEMRLRAAEQADRPSFGEFTPGALPVTGYHFSKASRDSISTSLYGTGLAGAERDRLAGKANADIRPRAFFYVDKGDGIWPEHGVGPHAHSVDLNNLYDATRDPQGLISGNPGINNWERAIVKAGFDGYVSTDPKSPQGYAVVIGKHDIPVKPLGMQTPRPGVALRFNARDVRPEIAEIARPVLRFLTPAERTKLRTDTAAKLVATLSDLPSSNEMAAIAWAGRAKRGWYHNSAQALQHVFNYDAPRFAALLAALSPQTSVESNLRNALNAWKNWTAAGRPTTERDIVQIMGESVEGERGEESVLEAWINNSVRALTAEDASKVVLSGPKVNSFMLNLVGVTEEVTNDAWMANYAAVDQTLFKGKLTKGGDPGKGPGYLAMSAGVRMAAARLSSLTNEQWTPAEVQETIWSWAKTLYELQSQDVSATDIINDGAMSDDLIASTPDFSSLFHEDEYASTLERAGYGRQLANLVGRADHAVAGDQEPVAGGQAGPFAEDTQQRHELRAARRLEDLKAKRDQEKQVKRKARLSARDNLGFYSELANQVEKSTMKQAPAAAWKTFIKALTQKGVKPDEIEWSGVNDWLDLQEGKVSKEALLDYLKDNGVQVQEVVLSEDGDDMSHATIHNTDEDGTTWHIYAEDGEPVGGSYSSEQDAQDDLDKMRGEPRAKYGQYTMPGGENYREVLLTLPSKRDQINAALGEANAAWMEARDEYGQGSAEERSAKALRDKLSKEFDANPIYRSGHWDQSNVLAHIRVNDRTDAEGARVLFVEELQSDAGQDKRKGKTDWIAPFIGDTSGWLNLALKRVITMAVQEGYDKVAFVNGEQSADRYDLSKQVSSIEATKRDPNVFPSRAGKWLLSVDGKDGAPIFTGDVAESDLEDYVGKEMAQRIVQDGGGTYSGLDLKVGGEGMKTFYDTIVPTAVKKLLPKVGGEKMIVVSIPTFGRDQSAVSGEDIMNWKGIPAAEQRGYWAALEQEQRDALFDAYRNRTLQGSVQPGFTITDAMREKVGGEGLPRFSARVSSENAERAVANSGLDLMSDEGIAEYNRTRNHGAQPNPEVILPGWDEDSSGMLSRPAYTADGELRWLRYADWEGRGVGLMVEDADGKELGFYPSSGNVMESARDDWATPEASRFDDAIYKMQDKHIDTKRVIEAIEKAGAPVGDDINVYLQEELFHGRAAKRVQDFSNDELKPMMEQIAKEGLTVADVEEYLHARHAKEANRIIAERNPDDAGLQDGGSGMSNADADAYFDKLSAEERAKFERVAAKVDDIIAATRQLYVDYGLESQEKVAGWGEMFQHYVPLMRERDGEERGMGIGQGFSVKGKEVKGRTGSKRKVVDILANIALQREKLIVRGEKNRVAQALVGLAAANPNPDFWSVGRPPAERVYDPDTNTVVERVDPMYKSRPNVLVAKVRADDGAIHEMAVVFEESNERALRMATALKNLDAAALEGILGVSAKITRYFAAVNTQYNPVFGVINLVRDVQAALVNLDGTPLAKKKGRIARDTISALTGIMGDMRAVRNGQHPTSQWSQLWEEFQREGGQTGYRDMFRTSAERAEEMAKALNPHAWADSKLGKFFTANGALRVPMEKAVNGVRWLFDLLSDYNESMENGVRLATYKAALDQGMSKEQAASLAKNLTVNFNRKGQAAQQAGALYAFFNASMQGTARLAQTVFRMDGGDIRTLRLTGTGRKVLYGGMLLGAIQALALAAAGFGDDDPPDFVRERSLIIPVGDKNYVTIPMPLGLHVIPGLGRHMTEFALGGFKNPAKRVVSVIGMLADAFNPIGNAGLSMQTIAPTALDPLVALTENRDWTGKPIARVSSNKAIPGHTQYKDTASSVAKLLAEGVNGLTGGNAYVAGALSPTPDQIDYLIGQVTGGVGRELSKVEQTALGIARGEEVPMYKVPLVGRFVGSASGQAHEGNAFYANVNRLNEIETEVKGLRKDGRHAEANAILRDRPESVLINQANVAERQIQRLKREKRALIERGASRDQVRAKDEQITAAMARLNRAMERASQ